MIKFWANSAEGDHGFLLAVFRLVKNQTKNMNFDALFIVPDFQQSLGYELCRRCIANELEPRQGLTAGILPVPSIQLHRPQQLPRQLALLPPSSNEPFTDERGPCRNL